MNEPQDQHQHPNHHHAVPQLYFLYLGQPPSDIPRNVTHVTIDSSVTKILDYAFLDCHFLAQVQFHDQLQAIGDSAFQRCRSLTSAKIPSSLKTIGQLAFSECSSLKEVHLPEGLTTIAYLTFGWCETLASIVIPKTVETIEMEAFVGCSELAFVRLDHDSPLKTIGSYAFSNCLSLTTMKLPSLLVTLGEGAFNYCLSLAQMELSPKLTAIEHNTFSWCRSLLQISIPDSVQTIGNGAFFNCTALRHVSLCDGLISIQRRAFHTCTCLERIHVPSTVSFLGDEAFYKCQSLVDVQLPPYLASIGDKVFWNCASLGSLIIPETVGCIGNEAFFYCLALSEINFPQHVRSIGSRAFGNCERLSAVAMPPNLTMLGSRAFSRCKNLLCVEFLPADRMERVTIGEHCFSECSSLVTLSIPSPSVWETTALSGCDALILKDVRFGLESGFLQQQIRQNLLALRGRFGFFPIHQVCYHTSLRTQDVNQVLRSNIQHAELKDYFGMTPLHVLATSVNPNVELLNTLLDHCSSIYKYLIQTDSQGLTMLDYLLKSTSCKVIPLIFVVLNRGLVNELSTWGLERWSTSVSLGLESMELDNDTKHAKVQNLFRLVGYYLRVEMTSLVELALWKKKFQEHSRYEDNGDGDSDLSDDSEHHYRISCRWHCGVDVVLQNVIGYLWDKSERSDQEDGVFRAHSCTATAISTYPLLSLPKLEESLAERI